MTDYKILLMKYIAIVATEEGIDFLNNYEPDSIVTKEDIAILKEASKDSEAFFNAATSSYIFNK